MKTSDQLRAARAMVRMEQSELARRAEVSVETIKRLESLPRALNAQAGTLRKIAAVLQLSGIEFIDKPPVGVRWSQDKQEALLAAIREDLVSAIDVALRANLFGANTRAQVIKGVVVTFSKVAPMNFEAHLPKDWGTSE